MSDKKEESSQFAYLKHVEPSTDVAVATRVLRDMRGMLHSRTIVHDGLLALWSLGMTFQNQEILTIFGAGQVTIDAMRKFEEDPEILKLCCGVIKNLGGNLLLIYRMGAGREIMNAMLKFPNERELQQQAMNAIKTLGNCKANSERLVQDHVVKLIVLSMKKHSDDAETLKCAIGALWCLCTAPGNKETIFSQGSAGAIISAMKAFPSVDRLQENGCGFLWTIGYHYSIMRLGAADVVLDAMRNHPQHKSIVNYGFFFVKNLGALGSNSTEFMDLEAPEVIMNCIRVMREPTVEENGLLALWSLSLWKDNKPILLEKKVALFALGILRANPPSPRVFCSAVSLLTNLSTIEDTPTSLLDRREAGRLVMSGYARHAEDEASVEKSLFCLRNLFYWDIEGLKELEGSIAFNQSLVRFPYNAVLQKKGRELLECVGNR